MGVRGKGERESEAERKKRSKSKGRKKDKRERGERKFLQEEIQENSLSACSHSFTN